jgi:hypothetical protein
MWHRPIFPSEGCWGPFSNIYTHVHLSLDPVYHRSLPCVCTFNHSVVLISFHSVSSPMQRLMIINWERRH